MAKTSAMDSKMYARDQASQALGIIVDQPAPGRAIARMTVREDTLNGHGICHGGMIFTLADTAFAFACNGPQRVAVAQRCSIDFLRPARLADALTATAEERAVTGRSGVYDVVVEDQNNELVALFRGNSRQIREQ